VDHNLSTANTRIFPAIRQPERKDLVALRARARRYSVLGASLNMTPSGTRGVLNDAVLFYFPDPALAGAFVARWCIGYKIETAEGAFRMREDEPAPRVGTGLHRTP
jgi:hypothetical protein